jgi:exodeoxyribonuclease V alpha subunit
VSNNFKKTSEASEYLSGSIERVTFHSEESGFCVLKVNVRGHRELVTVVGKSMTVTAGEYVDAEGIWITNREYGLQFQAKELRIILPSTLAGIEKYLGSGLVKGVGAHFAKRLVESFGEKVFEVIEQEPDKLMELPGIGTHRRDKIMQSWTDQKKIREIVVFLHSHGVGTARAVRIYKTYGQQAIERLRENPYALALDIRGIGFKTADALAERLGVPRHSLMRAQAGVRHVLQEISSLGHCAVPLPKLIEETSELLEIPTDIIQEAIDQEQAEERIILEIIDSNPHIFLANLYYAEVGVTLKLKQLLNARKSWGENEKINSDKAILGVELETKIVLSRTQREAVKLALSSKVIIITGGPGVGKTTVVNTILKIIRSYTRRILLCAPTGRAAKRLSESTGLEAKTLHRLLEFDPQKYNFKRNEYNLLEADLIVLDETSMVDLPMMHRFLKAVPDECGLMLVGDGDQLPSVGPGMILTNLIDSGTIPTIHLTEIFRQAASSQIIVNAHRINKGHIPKLKYEPGEITDFYFVEANTPELIQQKLLHIVGERIPKRFHLDPLRQIQVLVPMNRGGLGVRALNSILQKHLNPHPSAEITRYGTSFAVNDKVIQTVNNYDKEVFNGDIGFIKKIDAEEGELCIEFEGRIVPYALDELDELSLAYATSIHKAQGSEYPAVVIPLAMQHFTLLERNLIYTAVTRGKVLVVIVGQPKALAMAVRTIKSGKRLTNLTNRLMETLDTVPHPFL